MKEFKGTPGPWAIKYWTTQNHRYAYRINAADNQETDEEAEANLKAISVLPQMLEALQEMVLLWESMSTVMKPLINEEGYLKAKAALSAALD